jgi:nitrogen PTS system EIIA component
MELREFFDKDAVALDIQADAKDDILRELIALLKLDEKSEGILFKMLKRRENLGSTGIGRGIAIPHCRSLVVNRLRVAFGRKPAAWTTPPSTTSRCTTSSSSLHHRWRSATSTCRCSGKLAQFAKDPEITDKLAALEAPDEFLALLEEKR